MNLGGNRRLVPLINVDLNYYFSAECLFNFIYLLIHDFMHSCTASNRFIIVENFTEAIVSAHTKN